MPNRGPRVFLLAGFLACALPTLLHAQGTRGTLQGSVTSGGTPVGAAQVTITDDGGRDAGHAVTDPQGRYRVQLSPGQYNVKTHALGFADLSLTRVNVTSGSTTTLNLTLTAQAFELDPVAVTALRRTEKALDAPASVSVVDEQRIRSQTVVNPIDHTLGLAGVDVAVQGLATRQVVTRGFNELFGTGLLMLTDYRHASLPSLRANLSHFIAPNDDDIERVEVLRGPASALYGPNAADGVVHFITKSPFDSRGTSMSVTGGGRSLFQATARHADVLSDHVAYKISGQYLRGRDWDAPPDPTDLAARDNDLERAAGELRIDYRMSNNATAVLTAGSTLAINNTEQTGIGRSQVANWRYDYAQLRASRGRLFAQAYLNRSDAGDSFSFQTLLPYYDRSTLFVAQLQDSYDLARRSTWTFGADYQRTDPKTNGTISGRNEDDDVMNEVGAYIQGETHLTSKVMLLTAGRADRNDRIGDVVFSPRVGLTFTPRDGQNFRATYNRAFATPTSTDLFLDIVAAKLDPLPYSLRAVGVPKGGFHFRRDCDGGICMASPFAPGTFMPLDATVLWPAVVQIMKANGVDLSALPAPTKADVSTLLRTLDLASGTFKAYDTTPSDLDPLTPTITNTLEGGYKGLLRNRVLLNADVYYTRRENFRGPLAVETPNAFLSAADLTTYLSKFMPASQAAALAAGIGGIAGSTTAPGIPLATVDPDHPLAGSDILLTYRSFGRVNVWGTDLSAQLVLNDNFSVGAAYSHVSDNFFPASSVGLTDLALNAPRDKVWLTASWREPAHDMTADIRARFVGAYPMADGVWIGHVAQFRTIDAEVGAALPHMRNARLSVSAQNLLNDRHAEFVGAAVLGRLLLARVQYTF
jgi:iron complex outermembrane receptor protein